MFGLGTKGIAAIAGLLVLVGAVIAGVAVASDSDYDAVHAPQWKAGYSFSYDVTLDLSSVSEGLEELGLPSETDVTFGPIAVKKEVLSTTYRDSDGQPAYVSAGTFPFSSMQNGAAALDLLASAPAFLTAERQSDLAPLPVVPDWDCRSDDCEGGGVDFFHGNPLTYISFPLTEGKRWEQEADLGIPMPLEELQGVSRVHVVGEAGEMVSVDLGELGTTDAVRVDIAYTPVGLQEVLAEFAASIEDAGFEIERFNVQLGMHEIIHYSPEYEAVVDHQYIVRALVDIAVKGSFQGHEIDESIYAEFNGILSATLTGAERVAKPDMSAMEILNTLTDADLISDPRGHVVDEVPYSVSIAGTHDRVNAADHEDVLYFGEINGDLPMGHSTSFSIATLGGEVLELAGHDGGLVYNADDPGIHTVTFKAVDEDGGLVSKASKVLIADYHTIEEVDCNLVGSCVGAHFQLAEGAQELIIETGAYQVLPGMAQFRLIGPDGHSYQADYDRFEFDAEELAEMAKGEYFIEYRDPSMVLQRIDVAIESNYGMPATAPAAQPDSGSGDMMGELLVQIDGALAGLI